MPVDYMHGQRSPLEIGEFIAGQFQKGRERKRDGYLAEALGAQGDAREAALQGAAKIDPNAALEYGDKLGKREDAWLGEAVGLTQHFLSLPEDQQATMYPEVAQRVHKLAGGRLPPPDAWGPQTKQGMQAFVAQVGGRLGQGVGGRVQSSYIDADGNRVAIMRDGSQKILGPNAENAQIMDTGDGIYGINRRTQTAAPVTLGGAPQPGPAPMPAQPQVDSAVPPDKLAAVANALRARNMPEAEIDAMLAEITGAQFQPDPAPAPGAPGPQLRSVPKPAEAARLANDEQRLAMERERLRLQQNADRRAGEKASVTAAKPLPVAALKVDLEIEDALAAGKNASETMARHLDRIAKGEVDVSPVAAGVGAVRRAVGAGRPQDANLAELKADIVKIVNDSLRLNKGVQTEGDAQRAFKEVMDSNDATTLVQALRRAIAINQRAIKLQQERRRILRANYGQQAAPAQDAPPAQDDFAGFKVLD